MKNRPKAPFHDQFMCHPRKFSSTLRKFVIYLVFLSFLSCGNQGDVKQLDDLSATTKDTSLYQRTESVVVTPKDLHNASESDKKQVKERNRLSEMSSEQILAVSVDSINQKKIVYSEGENFSVEEPMEGELLLSEEQLIKTEVIPVLHPDVKDEIDSLLLSIEERIEIEPSHVENEIIVERWISPVNFEGYKFNRKKLVLYGVRKREKLVVHCYADTYYLSLRERIFTLEESLSPKGLMACADSLLTNYLLIYEDKL